MYRAKVWISQHTLVASLWPTEYPNLAVRRRRDYLAVVIQMDEHSHRAIGTPDLAISVFELRRSGKAYPQAELNLLNEEQSIHVSVVRIIGQISRKLSQFSYLDFLIYLVFIVSLAVVPEILALLFPGSYASLNQIL